MNLYTLSKQMQEILNMWYDEDTTKELLEGYSIVAEDQIEDIVKTIRNLEVYIAWYTWEIKRLSDKKARTQKTIDSLEWLIDTFMQQTWVDKINTSIAKIFYKESKAVLIRDAWLLSDEYMRVVPESKEPDKVKIKQWIEKWVIVEGAYLEIRNNLQIK